MSEQSDEKYLTSPCRIWNLGKLKHFEILLISLEETRETNMKNGRLISVFILLVSMRDDWDDKEISFGISPNLTLNLVSEELEKKYLSSCWRIRRFNAMQIWTQFETFLRSLEETHVRSLGSFTIEEKSEKQETVIALYLISLLSGDCLRC